MSFEFSPEHQGNIIWNILSEEMKSFQLVTSKCDNDNCKKTTEETTLSNCGRCRNVKYCSVECQKISWKTHQKKCEVFNFKENTMYFFLKGDKGYYYHKESKEQLYIRLPKSTDEEVIKIINEIVEKKLNARLIPIKENKEQLSHKAQAEILLPQGMESFQMAASKCDHCNKTSTFLKKEKKKVKYLWQM
jgi:hypothetical protein